MEGVQGKAGEASVGMESGRLSCFQADPAITVHFLTSIFRQAVSELPSGRLFIRDELAG